LCTVLLNYGLTMLLMAAGAAADIPAVLKAARPLAASLIVDVTNLLSDIFRAQNFSDPDVWKQIAPAALKAFLTALTSQRLATLLLSITTAIVEGTVEDAIPIAGQIMLGISLTAGVATLLETTLEIAASPVSYVHDLVLTHDITVNVLHDPKDDKFRTAADYYKVTALFDNGGTPHTQTLTMPSGVVSSLPPVVFTACPGAAASPCRSASIPDRATRTRTTGSPPRGRRASSPMRSTSCRI